jgi:hypothetical protein
MHLLLDSTMTMAKVFTRPVLFPHMRLLLFPTEASSTTLLLLVLATRPVALARLVTDPTTTAADTDIVLFVVDRHSRLTLISSKAHAVCCFGPVPLATATFILHPRQPDLLLLLDLHYGTVFDHGILRRCESGGGKVMRNEEELVRVGSYMPGCEEVVG